MMQDLLRPMSARLLVAIGTAWIIAFFGLWIVFVVLTWFVSPEDLPFELPHFVVWWYDLQGVGPVDLARGLVSLLILPALVPGFLAFWAASKLRPTTTSPQVADSAERIVRAYGQVLGAPSTDIRGTSELPYPKDVIGDALLTAMRACEHSSEREPLKAGYVALSDFQELTPEQQAAAALYRAAIAPSSGGSAEEAKGRALTIAETERLLEPMRKLASQEAAERASRVRTLD